MDKLTKDLARKIRAASYSQGPIKAELSTDERVLARVTDGIYRQPSSALRELISNAYDADAETVTITTDAPRFEEIRVMDDGNGMNDAALANLIYHIGGSSKRRSLDSELGVVSSKDPTKSPGGRKLIGKIGIGLFSVAQLTRHFQIITKVKNQKFRLVADVVLHTHLDDETAKAKKGKQKFQTGSVQIWKVPAEDTHAHGTEIIISDITRQAQDILRSRERWLHLDPDEDADVIKAAKRQEPQYHIGVFDVSSGGTLSSKAALPWQPEDSPKDRFTKLHSAIIDAAQKEPNPQLARTFDNYLNMVWALSLAAPLPYIETAPYELKGGDVERALKISNKPKAQATTLALKKNENIGKHFDLGHNSQRPKDPFHVFIDGIELFRPLTFKSYARTTAALKEPVMFLGSYKPNLSKHKKEITGGDLEFSAYILWVPKVIPKEHNGVLIRVNNASGTLFDSTFMGYQISERTRLGQMVVEIFVSEGLDPALNIDRESFNYAHPHYRAIRNWLHNALRQSANHLKGISSELRKKRVLSENRKNLKGLASRIETLLGSRLEEGEELPEIEIIETGERKPRGADAVYREDRIFPQTDIKPGTAQDFVRKANEEKVKAIAQVLIAYGVFDAVPYSTQEEILRVIMEVISE